MPRKTASPAASKEGSLPPPTHQCPEQPGVNQGATNTPLSRAVTNTVWPSGKRHKRLLYSFAELFFSTIATSTNSLFRILHDNPSFPPYSQLMHWKKTRPWFKEAWQHAREAQAEFLIQQTLDIAKAATPKTAHVARVQFDIYRYIASRFAPAIYGDKAQTSTSTSLNVNVAVVPAERITDLRQRLEHTRDHFRQLNGSRSAADPPQHPDNDQDHNLTSDQLQTSDHDLRSVPPQTSAQSPVQDQVRTQNRKEVGRRIP